MINTDTVIKYYFNFFNVKSYLRYLAVLKHHKKVKSSDVFPNSEDCFTLFNFNGPLWHYDSGRYTYLLVKSFHLAGFAIILQTNYGLLSRLIKYKYLLRKIPFQLTDQLMFQKGLAEKNTVLIKKGPLVKEVHLCFKLGDVKLKENDFRMPYLMHPMIYSEGYDKKVFELREQKSYCKILFAGNTDKREYSREALKKKFNKTNRFQAISYVIDHLAESELQIIKNQERLDDTGEYRNKLLIVRSSDHKISFTNWLPAIAGADFFFAASGSRMPMCHNAVEAMAVGSIPLLEYPEYFHPPLKNGYNCIVYSGCEDLKRKIQDILEMPPNEIAALKLNVINYYESYLDPQKWIDDLLRLPHREVNLIMDAYLTPSKKETPTDA